MSHRSLVSTILNYGWSILHNIKLTSTWIFQTVKASNIMHGFVCCLWGSHSCDWRVQSTRLQYHTVKNMPVILEEYTTFVWGLKSTLHKILAEVDGICWLLAWFTCHPCRHLAPCSSHLSCFERKSMKGGIKLYLFPSIDHTFTTWYMF